MLEHNFKIGDRVITVERLFSKLPKGFKGIIVNFQDTAVGVEWEAYTGGHNCDGHCKRGKGFYVSADKIKLDIKQTFIVEESGEYNIREQ